MKDKLPAVVNLKAVLEGDSNTNTLQVDISWGVRAPVVNGSVTLQGLWRADLYEYSTRAVRAKKPIHLGTFVTDSSKDESPADLLRQLADIYEAGELKVVDQ